jgi:hypothetical protein
MDNLVLIDVMIGKMIVVLMIVMNVAMIGKMMIENMIAVLIEEKVEETKIVFALKKEDTVIVDMVAKDGCDYSLRIHETISCIGKSLNDMVVAAVPILL